MLTVPTWLLIVAEQSFIVLIVLVIFFPLRARKYKNPMLQYNSSSKEDFDRQVIATKKILSPPDLKDLGVIKEKLALAAQRVKNLERFRELFLI